MGKDVSRKEAKQILLSKSDRSERQKDEEKHHTGEAAKRRNEETEGANAIWQ